MLAVCAVIYTRAGSVPGNRQGRRCPHRQGSSEQRVTVGQDPDPPSADPQHPSKRSRTGPGTVTWVRREFKATRQGQGQAGKPTQHSKGRLSAVKDRALLLLCSSGRDRALSLKLILSLGLKADAS